MDTSYCERFGAVGLPGTYPVLARSARACASLARAIGAQQGKAAVEMLKHGHVTGALGDEIHDFFADEIMNKSSVVWEGLIYDPEQPDNPDSQFPVQICEYEGIYFVHALEYDRIGYFLRLSDARSVAKGNWDNVKELGESVKRARRKKRG